jgi:cobalt-zinc-cadmium efflux system outer membrane protein
LSAAAYDAQAAGAAVRGAKALTNPDFVVLPSVIGSAGTDSTLLLVQPLEINGTRSARTRVATGECIAAQAGLQATRNTLLRDVKIAYWDVARVQAITKLNCDNVASLESLLAAAKRQVDVGTAPGSHVTKAEVELARAKQELAIAEKELSQSKASLNTLLARDPCTQFTAVDPLTFTPAQPLPDCPADQAVKNRPEIAQEQALLAAREAEITQAKAQGRPDVLVQARLEEFDGPGGIAVGLTLPIFDWGSRRSEIKQAKSAACAQSKRLDAQKYQVRLEVANASTAAVQAACAVRDYESGVLSKSEQLAQMAEKGYKTGATSYLEVLEAQRTLRSVKIDYTNALANYEKAKAELEWAISSTAQCVEVAK